MKSNKHLGASWESSSLHFVESSETTPEKVFHVPFEPRSQTLTAKNTLDLWESDLAKNIRDALKKHKVSTTIVNLSLPTNDIIFRSFVIPWMQQREIKSVVEFEIGKYIPFSLSELSHSHHAISIAENNIKQIRIIFVAIKNDALANYVRVFKAASLTPDVIEPSALSLIRALSFKKLIPEDQTIAVIQKGDVGKIIICNKNTPQFVREFFLSGINPR
jgi:Tfp pilus assembly PilM family ATPase